MGRMAEIGLVPEQDFDESKLPRLGHKLDPKLALLELLRTMKGKELVNGWLYWTSDVGQYGTDYETRALVTMIGPGMNFAEDAVYPLSEKDADGDEYDGSKHRYLMRFEQGRLPPVKGFWSLTMYDPDYFFVPNSIDRYCLSQRDTFVANEDGSVDLYLQADRPPRTRRRTGSGPQREVQADPPSLLARRHAAHDPGRIMDAATREARRLMGP